MNDEKFRLRLEVGLEWERRVASFLESIGQKCTLDQSQDKPDDYDWKKESWDIVLEDGSVVEVKSRSGKYPFTCPDDFPFDDILIDPIMKYDSKRIKPLVYIFISQKTGAMVWLPTDTDEHWTTKIVRDPYSGYRYRTYSAPRSLLRPIEELADFLNSR